MPAATSPAKPPAGKGGTGDKGGKERMVLVLWRAALPSRLPVRTLRPAPYASLLGMEATCLPGPEHADLEVVVPERRRKGQERQQRQGQQRRQRQGRQRRQRRQGHRRPGPCAVSNARRDGIGLGRPMGRIPGRRYGPRVASRLRQTADPVEELLQRPGGSCRRARGGEAATRRAATTPQAAASSRSEVAGECHAEAAKSR